MDIKKYSDNGFCIVKDFLSPANAQQLHSKIFNYTQSNGNINEIFTYPESLIRFFDPRIYTRHKFKLSHFSFSLGLNLLSAKKNKKMKEIRYFLKLRKCNRIDSYFSEISKNEIIEPVNNFV